MADEPDKPPPTYAELLEQNEKLQAYAIHLEEAVKALHASVGLRDAEIQRLTLVGRKKRTAPLDPESPDPFRRPYDGR